MLILSILAFFYFLPSILGHSKHGSNGIFLLNLFFGWTVIGWIVALIWALAASRRSTRIVIDRIVSTRDDLLSRLESMRLRGTISTDQYWEERKRYNLL